MNRPAIVYVIVFTTVIMLLVTGCATGVSQEEYDKVSSKLASAQDQISIWQSNYEKAINDLANIQDQLAELQNGYKNTNSDSIETQTQRDALQDDCTKVKRDLIAVQAEISALERRILELYSARPTTTVEITKDIEYGRTDGIPLLLDIYTPETPITSPIPAIIWIHGGGWIGGDKGNDRWFNNLATHGFFVVSINYRLSGEALFPAAVEDSKCAVRWLRANAEMYNIDPEHFGVAGSSAGGHLAMMVGLVDKTAGLEGNGGWEEFSSRVQAVVPYFGPSELRRGTSTVKFIGGTLEDKPEIYKIASPINYVTEDDPPLLLIHGEQDTTVPYNHSEQIYRSYQQAGLEAELIKVSNAGHGFRQETDSPISPSLDEIEQERLDFFIKYLLLNR